MKLIATEDYSRLVDLVRASRQVVVTMTPNQDHTRMCCDRETFERLAAALDMMPNVEP